MHWPQTNIQIVCFIYFWCEDATVVPQLYHEPGHRYNLSRVRVFCLDELWLLSGPHAWAFPAWKQTHGKVEGGDASQNPSPLYSQQGAWNCFRVSNMQLQKSFWFIQFPALHKKSQLYFALFKMSLLLWTTSFAVELVMHFQKSCHEPYLIQVFFFKIEYDPF